MAGIYYHGYRIHSAAHCSQASTRAQVFAWYDYIKSELPDVFFVQNNDRPLIPSTSPSRPIRHIRGRPIDQHGPGQLHAADGQLGRGGHHAEPGYGDGNLSNPVGTGIFGARTSPPRGFTRTWATCRPATTASTTTATGWSTIGPRGSSSTNQALVQSNLAAHQHNTARSEMLYAILVEGVGPLGSVFSRDDFSDRRSGHRRRRAARVRGRLGPAAPVLPLAALVPHRHPARAGDRLLGLHADTSRCVGRRALQPALSLGLRGPRAGPAGPQPAAHGAGLVVVGTGRRTRARRSQSLGGTGRVASAAAAGCWPSSTSSTGSPSLLQHTGNARVLLGPGVDFPHTAGPSSPSR